LEQFIEVILLKNPKETIFELLDLLITDILKDNIFDGSSRATEVLLKISKVLALNSKAFCKYIGNFVIPYLNK
jgi:hypothetical protein